MHKAQLERRHTQAGRGWRKNAEDLIMALEILQEWYRMLKVCQETGNERKARRFLARSGSAWQRVCSPALWWATQGLEVRPPGILLGHREEAEE